MNLGPLWKDVDKRLEAEIMPSVGFYDLFALKPKRTVWVCEYCGRQTFEPHESCNGCGAPLDLKGNE